VTPVIETTGVGKLYRLGFMGRKSVRALTGCSLTVNEGEVFGIIGPNGAGKSTVIKILLNLVFATEGRATLFGLDVADPRSRKNVGYVPENPVPYEHLTGLEYLEFQAQLAGLHGADARAQIDRALERVEMKVHARLPIRRYSKGMTQRAMLAGALLGQPRLVILDEPTSGLDPLGRRLVRELIVEMRKAGTTVLFCTHIISDVESLCDRVALLVGGRVRKSGPIAELTQARRQHEVTLEGVTLAEVQPRLSASARASEVGRNVLISVPDEELQAQLKAALDAGWRVGRVAPLAYSLEQTFIETVQGTSQTVGAEIQ
jgi:ABC-2 type transport system ATP-binding protein